MFLVMLSKKSQRLGGLSMRECFTIDAKSIEDAKNYALHYLDGQGNFEIGEYTPRLFAETKTSYRWKEQVGDEILPMKKEKA